MDAVMELQSRLQSIAADSDFCAAFCASHPDVPVFANLRCGNWYTSSQEHCYFKSTDGHKGNWSFPLTRLNLNVAIRAGSGNGAIIVDSTRAKVAPDSFSKTVPIWAAVLNRAVARLRRAPPDEAPVDPDLKVGLTLDMASWDCALHLPAWIRSEETEHISSRLDFFVESLLSSGADFGPLCTALAKPLRAVWVDPHAVHCMDSASELNLFPSLCSESGREGKLPASQVSWADLPFIPIVCLSVSHGKRGLGCKAPWLPPTWASLPATSPPGPQSCSRQAPPPRWTYVPGAGDDEESWALGLTPGLFRAHRDLLLSPSLSADQCVDLVLRLVKQDRPLAGRLKHHRVLLQTRADEPGSLLPSQPDSGSGSTEAKTELGSGHQVARGQKSQVFPIGETGVSVVLLESDLALDELLGTYDGIIICTADAAAAAQTTTAAVPSDPHSPTPDPAAQLAEVDMPRQSGPGVAGRGSKRRVRPKDKRGQPQPVLQSDQVLRLAIVDDKREKRSLTNVFDFALAFAHGHLLPPADISESVATASHRPRLLVAAGDLGIAVAMAVALLLGLGRGVPVPKCPDQAPEPAQARSELVDKDLVRQTLNYVQGFCPTVFPSRQFLKQIARYFQLRYRESHSSS